MTMTTTPGGFFAADSTPRGDDRPLPVTRTRAAIQIPDVLTPQAVADVSRRLRAFGLERRTLKEQPSTPSTTRRVSALSLLIDDAKTELLAAVAATKDTWTAALAEHVAATTETYTTAVRDLDTTRAAVTETGQVLAWLTDSTGVGLRRFTLLPPGQLDGTPWPTVIAALFGELGHTHDTGPSAVVQGPVFAGSLRETIASFPLLDMPERIADVHQRHHQLLDQHHTLGAERRKLEDTRKTAEAQDRRELADSIAKGTKDPEDRHVAKLDDQVAAVDAQRAALTVDIRDTHATLRRLLREHRETWRDTIAARHTTAVQAYTAAVAALPAARTAHHTTRAAAAWLNKTTPADLGRWTPQEPAIAGQSFDVLLSQLRRDVATQRQLGPTTTRGDDAA